MKLQLDNSIPYAICMEGGGARGAWQIGVWLALREAGIKIEAVSGTSVGALNGALVTMNQPDRARELWESIRFSQVMDVQDEDMVKLAEKDFFHLNLSRITDKAKGVIRDGGFDVAPLRAMLHRVVDEELIRRSPIRFFLVTYCVTDKKTLELEAGLLPPGKVPDMLLASAYFPAFKHEPLDGKMYTDGGVKDVLPLHVLYEHGYRDVIALRIHGVGVERPVKTPKDARLRVIEPRRELGSVLDFDPAHTKANLRLGYYDGMRYLYGLVGKKYYIDRTMSETDAYEVLYRMAAKVYGKKSVPGMRQMNEVEIPKLARAVGASPTDGYYEIYLMLLEKSAEKLGIDEYCVITDWELAGEIREAAAGKRAGLGKFWQE